MVPTSTNIHICAKYVSRLNKYLIANGSERACVCVAYVYTRVRWACSCAPVCTIRPVSDHSSHYDLNVYGSRGDDQKKTRATVPGRCAVIPSRVGVTNLIGPRDFVSCSTFGVYEKSGICNSAWTALEFLRSKNIKKSWIGYQKISEIAVLLHPPLLPPFWGLTESYAFFLPLPPSKARNVDEWGKSRRNVNGEMQINDL